MADTVLTKIFRQRLLDAKFGAEMTPDDLVPFAQEHESLQRDYVSLAVHSSDLIASLLEYAGHRERCPCGEWVTRILKHNWEESQVLNDDGELHGCEVTG